VGALRPVGVDDGAVGGVHGVSGGVAGAGLRRKFLEVTQFG
jgi:hypothetical protein